MKLTKRGRVYVVDCYIDGRRVRKSTGETCVQAARKQAITIVARLRADAGVCDWTLEAAMNDTYTRIWSQHKSSVHVHKRIMKLSREYSTWMEMPLDRLDYQQLDYLGIAMEGKGIKGSTVNRFLALISKACTEAVRLGKVDRRPEFPYRPESKGKLRWITPGEEQVLYREAEKLWPRPDANDMVALIMVLVDTGARLSEVLKAPKIGGLTRITFEDTKNGSTRSVPLTARAAEALPQVPNWTAMQAIGRFSRLRDAAGMPDVTLHTLRHTCASRLVQGGMDLYMVKDWLGHSSITVTQRYAHLSPNNLVTGIDILQATTAPIGEDTHSNGRNVVTLRAVK